MVTIATAFIHSLTHAFNTNYRTSCIVLGILGIGDVMSKTVPALMELHSSGEKDNKQKRK